MRILTAFEQVSVFHAAATRLYRGINVDTTAPGLEKVHAILHPSGQQNPLEHHPGWDHPEVGGHLLDWLGTGPKKGMGSHWTTDPAQAEQFARWPNEQTGRGGNLQAVIEGEWGGQGEDTHRTDTHEFNEKGERIRSFPQEHETTLSPGAAVNVTGLRIRPHDDDYWNGPNTGDESPDENHEGPWHQALSGPSTRTAGVF